MRYFKSLLLAAAITASVAYAQTDTTFTYQGELKDAGNAANGTFNFDFAIFDALNGGNQIGLDVTINGHPVVDGLFTVELDFGASTFNNDSRWIEISVNGTELSPRQPVTRSPYSIQTRGIFVDANNDVGIGTSNPLYPLHVSSDSHRAIYGHSSSSSNIITTYGVYGEADGSIGRGVFGKANAFSGNTAGVFGWSLSSSGTGVFGFSTATNGTTFGGQFENWSTSGRGVFGHATASTGLTDGVFGLSNSTSGRGICGWASANVGDTYGVFGTSSSTDGTGVKGVANATTGNTFGGQFESESNNGFGVLGYASAGSGITAGVYGISNSSAGWDFFAAGLGQNYGSISSRRWKNNIEPISDPLTKLAQLRGVYYDWDEEHGGQHDLGMIAEEVGKVLPEIVNYEENGIDAIGMDYSKMTPLLVEATNALREKHDAQIAELRQQNAQLQARLTRIESLLVQLATE